MLENTYLDVRDYKTEVLEEIEEILEQFGYQRFSDCKGNFEKRAQVWIEGGVQTWGALNGASTITLETLRDLNNKRLLLEKETKETMEDLGFTLSKTIVYKWGLVEQVYSKGSLKVTVSHSKVCNIYVFDTWEDLRKYLKSHYRSFPSKGHIKIDNLYHGTVIGIIKKLEGLGYTDGTSVGASYRNTLKWCKGSWWYDYNAISLPEYTLADLEVQDE